MTGTLAHSHPIEAPLLYTRGQYSYLFANWGTCRKRGAEYLHHQDRAKPEDNGPYLNMVGRKRTCRKSSDYKVSSSYFVTDIMSGDCEITK
jgi:hypothetical protein